MNLTTFKKSVFIFFIVACSICTVACIIENKQMAMVINIVAVILNTINLIVECKKDRE